MCCSHKLHNFAPHMKETAFFLAIQTGRAFLLFGVEAGVIFFWESATGQDTFSFCSTTYRPSKQMGESSNF